MKINLKAINLQESPENESMVSICSYTEKVLQNLIDYRFTDHSIKHCYRMLKIADRILEQTRKESLLTSSKS